VLDLARDRLLVVRQAELLGTFARVDGAIIENLSARLNGRHECTECVP
jgi:hypothetical protein